ncbi:protein MTSS 2 isoform X6 [Onthophagus taurus]|uniref:protein MTSS 2 isoform X6 n=1 Tax=Onthophagus taurus TaxID=166361 RepID=UPI000C1FE7C1|nr:MTSS1-like protein isoform X5 [Onthophagus taurus]
MEVPVERGEAGALGGLFQQIIQDMKNGMPLWEDLIAKATKLHSTLRAAILAVTAYLEAFQKIADAATSARGATREIGTALTRICLRQKAVEAKMKTFTSAIMDCLVVPLQEKLEDWKKTVFTLDKEHAKEYKKARAELKKRSTDTLRLQKKMRKGAGGDLQKRLEYGLQDVNERKHFLEETEKQAVRAALLEERNRFCTFVEFLKPVVDEEIAMLSELSRVQEVVQQLDKHTADPKTLPPASEQVIADLKSSDSGWSFQTPPSSPSSLGSRKSSMCSISSLNSSSSGSSKSHHSPSHPHWHRSLSQPVSRSGTLRYTSVLSQDSGFTSQDTLYPRPPSSLSIAQVSNMSEHSNNSSSSSTPCTPFPATTLPNSTATWPNLQETVQFERAANAIVGDRPHTISSVMPQPTYVNMHELASMAANKAQELNLPPPPAEFITPAPTPTEKGPNEGEKDGSTSESSLESSSGYGSQTTFTVDDAGNQDVEIQCEFEATSKYCTLPRNINGDQFSTNRRRPVSMSALYSSTMRSTLLRRSSVQTAKPPPPIRRTSSITNTNRPLTPVGSMENLPPPPAFLLEPSNSPKPAPNIGVNVAETVKALTELKHTPASPNAIRRSAPQIQNVVYSTSPNMQQSPILSSFQGGAKKLSYVSQSGGVIYAQPSQVIPGSPSAVRKISLRSQSADRKSGEGPGGVGSNFIAALSAKLAPSISPRSSRRHSEDLVPGVNVNMCGQQNTTRGPGQTFLDSLNAKLAQQHITNNCSAQQTRVNKIRQIINSKTVSDPKICHESLMDQIKRGATLKRPKMVNDRSAPKIF